MALEIGGAGIFVRRVSVGVQQADGDGLDFITAAARDDGVEVFGPQWPEHLSVPVDALPHLKPPAPGDEWARLLEPHVIQVRAVAAADLQHVAKPGRGDQRGPDPFAFGDRIDDDGRAVDHVAHIREAHLADGNRVHNPVGERARCGQGLGHIDIAADLVEDDEIGEGSSDVGCQAQAHRAAPCDRWVRSRCVASRSRASSRIMTP